MTEHRVLHLMRHAAAVPSSPLGDLYRSLSPLGHEQAASIRAQLPRDITRVIVSPAARTRQTVADLALGVDVEIDERLWGAGGESVLRTLAGCPGDVTHLLVVGHSPGMPEAVRTLVGRHAPDRFGTATCCRIEATGSWAALSNAKLVATYVA